MRAALIERLACPLCHGPYEWSVARRSDDVLLEADVRCPSCGTTSVVRDGVGYFRPGDAQPPPATAGDAPLPEDWSEALRELRGPSAPPSGSGEPRRLEIAFRGFGPEVGAASGPGLLAAEEGARGVPAPSSPPPDTAPDVIVVELHSLPLKDRSFTAVFAGPGLQVAPGRRVLLRELRRVVDGPLHAVVLVTPASGGGEGGAPARAHPMALEPLLDDLRRAHWRPTLGTPTVAEVGLGPSPGGPRSGRLAWVHAE